MSQINLSKPEPASGWAWLGYGVGAWLISFAVTLLGGFLLQTPLGASLVAMVNRVFLLDSTQVAWYVTRAAGIVSYVLVWLSTMLGLGVGSKVFNRVLGGGLTFDLHEFTSLLALGFVGLHVIVLLGDQYLPYTLTQILLPFLSPYRPVWVGIGVLAFLLISAGDSDVLSAQPDRHAHFPPDPPGQLRRYLGSHCMASSRAR